MPSEVPFVPKKSSIVPCGPSLFVEIETEFVSNRMIATAEAATTRIFPGVLLSMVISACLICASSSARANSDLAASSFNRAISSPESCVVLNRPTSPIASPAMSIFSDLLSNRFLAEASLGISLNSAMYSPTHPAITSNSPAYSAHSQSNDDEEIKAIAPRRYRRILSMRLSLVNRKRRTVFAVSHLCPLPENATGSPARPDSDNAAIRQQQCRASPELGGLAVSGAMLRSPSAAVRDPLALHSGLLVVLPSLRLRKAGRSRGSKTCLWKDYDSKPAFSLPGRASPRPITRLALRNDSPLANILFGFARWRVFTHRSK